MNNIMFSYKNCVVCESVAKFHCQRCIETYCSTECQIMDWPNHKFICAPMPKLVTLQTLDAPFRKSYLNSISCITKTSNLKLGDESVAKHITPLRRPHLDTPAHLSFDETLNNLNGIENEMKTIDDLNKNLDNNDKEIYYQCVTKNNNSDLPRETFSNLNKKSIEIKSAISKLSTDSNASLTSDSSKTNKEFYDDNGILNNSALKVNSCNSGQVSGETHFTNIESVINSDCTKDDNRSTVTGISSVAKKLWKTVFPIPENEFFTVVIQYYDINAKLAWVTDVRLLKKQEKFLEKINLQSRSMQSIMKTDDIHFGNLYGVRYSDEIFYRAVCVEEINPLNEVKVRLLDYGNNFTVKNYQELQYSTALMQNNNAFAFCIRYPDKVEIGKVLKICIDFKELDPILGCVYSIKEDIIGLSTNRNEVALPNCSILNNLPSKFKVKIINFIDENSERCAFVEIIEEHSEIRFKKMNEILNSEQSHDFASKPKKGDFVAARFGNMWRRAIILDIFAEEYLIFIADVPEVNFVNQIKKLPKEYQELPLNIALIQIEQILIDHNSFYSKFFKCFSVLDIINYDATLFKDSMNTCDLYEQNVKIGKVILKNFDGNFPAIMGNNVWIIHPKNDDIVRITEIVNHYTVYIAVSNVYDYYRTNLNIIGKFIEENLRNKNIENNSIYLEKSIVLVKNDVEEYARCRILKVTPTNEYEVFNLDSGSVFQTKKDNLLPANDYVKFMPVITAKIILKDVNLIRGKSSATTVCLKKLINFLDENIQFKVKFDSKMKDNVYLNFCNNDKGSLNDILVSELEKNLNQSGTIETVKDFETKCNVDSKILIKKYYIKDIEVIPIPTEKNVEILTLDNSFLNFGFITGCIKDKDFLQKLFGVYQNDIDKFCADPSNGTEYLPEIDEICLALFDTDGHWYRAFCLQIKNDKFNVMFVDYGNIVWITKNKIRKFDKKFLHKTAANTCFINGIAKDSSNQEKLKNFSEKFFLLNDFFIADEVIAISDCEYLITLKEVTKYFE